MALLVSGVVGIGAALALGEPAVDVLRDAHLALLLRGMAAIKSAVVLAAGTAVFWRFRYPVDRRVAIGYVAGLSLSAAASTLIWLLSNIAFAALAFHVAAAVVFVTAWRDDRGPRWWKLQNR